MVKPAKPPQDGGSYKPHECAGAERVTRVPFQYHPDRFRGHSSSEAEAALKRFLQVDAAWRILKDQESRRQYDLKLRGGWPTDRSGDLCQNPPGARLAAAIVVAL